MNLLAIKTDGDPTEIFLLDESGKKIREKIWIARRTLARDLLAEIKGLIGELADDENDIFSQIKGVIVYEGPGSFTGLRIGITAANAIAYAENIKIVGVSGDNWLLDGVRKIREKSEFSNENEEALTQKMEENLKKETDENGVIFSKKTDLEESAKLKIVMPKYGGQAHITAPKK